MRGRKLRSGVNLQEVLKQKGVKQKLCSHLVSVTESSRPKIVKPKTRGRKFRKWRQSARGVKTKKA
jgi:hypothetical protein